MDRNDDDRYDFSHKRRGYMVVIVNENFRDTEEHRRDGAAEDLKNIIEIARKLGFKIYNKGNTYDLNKKATMKLLRQAQSEDHSDSDCFAVFISTHGQEQSDARLNGRVDHALVCSDHQLIFTRDIVAMFNDRNCPSLAGKPKLFFIQACRGSNVDSGCEVRVAYPKPREMGNDVTDNREDPDIHDKNDGCTTPVSNTNASLSPMVTDSWNKNDLQFSTTDAMGQTRIATAMAQTGNQQDYSLSATNDFNETSLSMKKNDKRGTSLSTTNGVDDHSIGLSTDNDDKQETSLSTTKDIDDNNTSLSMTNDVKQDTSLSTTTDNYEHGTSLSTINKDEQDTSMSTTGDVEQKTSLSTKNDDEEEASLSTTDDDEHAASLSMTNDVERDNSMSTTNDDEQVTIPSSTNDYEQETSLSTTNVGNQITNKLSRNNQSDEPDIRLASITKLFRRPFQKKIKIAVSDVHSTRCDRDMLVMFAVPDGMYAFRNRDWGSWMIRALTLVIRDYDLRYPVSFLKLMTRVASIISDRETSTDDEDTNAKKCISVIEHKLTKDVFFQHK